MLFLHSIIIIISIFLSNDFFDKHLSSTIIVVLNGVNRNAQVSGDANKIETCNTIAGVSES